MLLPVYKEFLKSTKVLKEEHNEVDILMPFYIKTNLPITFMIKTSLFC
jgi:hypothetical protein